MRLYEFGDLKWLGSAIILATFLLKIYLSPVDYFGLAIVGAAIACLIMSLAWSIKSLPEPNVYWDNQRGISAIFRFWSVEVDAARLLASVPIGIDLSHSGKKVLQSMHTRYTNEPGGELVFFIMRPLDNQSSKIGFLVRRRAIRLWNGFRSVENLSNKLVTDIAILERAMRAAYPHLPVEPASFQDIVRTASGGFETHALV